MRIKEQLLELKPYQPGKPIDEVKKEFGLEKIVKLASNENPYGYSHFVREAIQKNLDSLAVYPDGYSATLRETVAEHLKVLPSQIIFGNGSDEIVQIICRALLTKETNTVMATPTFPQYRHNAVIEGAEIREVELINGCHDLDNMIKAIDANTTVVWVCSPNNPTGTYVNKDNLTSFIEKVPKHVLIVLDEAYYEYVTASDYPNTVDLLEKYNNLIILRTFSKAYGLAGLRIGYGIGTPQLIKQLEPAREPFNTNKLAQIAATAAVKDEEFIKECKIKNKNGLEQFYKFCRENGLFYYLSEGNFILIDFKLQGNEVFQFLLERGFIVRSGNALGFPTSIRITVGTQEQNEELIALLTELVKNKTAV
ncbi:histidinol-phosphate transaminase [Bacillus timonensis]|nr:histidinol-phosphate transaminase [Bacillus timonensis]